MLCITPVCQCHCSITASLQHIQLFVTLSISPRIIWTKKFLCFHPINKVKFSVSTILDDDIIFLPIMIYYVLPSQFTSDCSFKPILKGEFTLTHYIINLIQAGAFGGSSGLGEAHSAPLPLHNFWTTNPNQMKLCRLNPWHHTNKIVIIFADFSKN